MSTSVLPASSGSSGHSSSSLPSSSSISSSTSTSASSSSSSSSSSITSSNSSSSDAIVEKYEFRPSYKNIFKPILVKKVLDQVLQSQLSTKQYDPNETGNWTKEIATLIKAQLKELKLPRYKFLVQVIIGEMKGAGVRCGCRCLWDQQTDKVAEATFTNDSLFCVAVAFGVYLY